MKDKLWNIVLTIAVGAVGYILNGALKTQERITSEMFAISSRITVIESSRFTTGDGLLIQRQLSDIREGLARVETELKVTRRP